MKDQIIARTDNETCANLKVEDIKGEIISIDLSKVGSIKCVNYYED
jgi:hypothetical protein